MRSNMKSSALCITLFAAVWISGCASAPKGPSFSEARIKDADPNKAVLYVYRKHAEPTLWDATITVDGTPGARLDEGSFTIIKLTPGSHTIKAVWAGMSGQRDSYISVNAKAGETHFVELTGISQVAGYLPVVGIMYRVGSGMAELDAQVALSTLSECCKLRKSDGLN
jgi:hypothetical protein